MIKDTANRTHLTKLLRFTSSSGKLADPAEYTKKIEDEQEHTFYTAGGSADEVKASPFVERLLQKGHEVLFLTEAVEEHAISTLP